MTGITDEPVSPARLRPLERHAQLETDAFCDCGYNLHGQVVTRDERLDFMICRCPECGRFHPAGHGTAARSQWLSRLAAAMLIVWSLFVLWATFMIMLASGALQVAVVDSMTYMGTFTDDMRPVEHMPQPNGTYALMYLDTNQPVPLAATMNLKSLRTFEPRGNNQWQTNPAYQANRRFERNLMFVFTIGLGWLTGVLGAIFLWHWHKRNYVWVTLAAILPAIFVASVVSTVDEYAYIRNWAISRVAMVAALQCVCILLGVWTGRPMGRFVARLIIPPRPRQFLAFLWRADGKTPPMVPAAAKP